ncbi:MAG: hypothetical protein K2N52_04805, partial [Clostridia bacterium]|nr:hypothetical protein [Clostridia bacterium]
NTYSGGLQIKKNVRTGNRKTAVEIKLDERILNDEYTVSHNPVKDEIDRIDLILKTIVMLLSTPLMEAVSKVPMLKPPITETNVLKMNKHFKGAKELYYFLAAYDKDGFEVVQKTEVLSPFKTETAEDFAQVIALLSFLTYEHGLGLKPELKEIYLKTLKEEEEEKSRELKQKIRSLKKRIEETGKGAEEYMLALEQDNRNMENDVLALAAARGEIEKLNENIAILQGNIESLGETVSQHIAEEERLKAEHAEEINSVVNECARQIKSAMDAHAQEIEQINVLHAEEIESLNETNGKRLEDMQSAMRAESERADERYSVLQSEKAEAEKQTLQLSAQFEKLRQDKLLTDAKLNALKKQFGLDTDDFTTEDRFDELERQYAALKALFKEEWKKSKKKIRREVLKPEQTEKAHSDEEPNG